MQMPELIQWIATGGSLYGMARVQAPCLARDFLEVWPGGAHPVMRRRQRGRAFASAMGPPGGEPVLPVTAPDPAGIMPG